MQINDLLFYSKIKNNAIKEHNHIFLLPYYLYLEEKIKSILADISIDLTVKFSEDITYQIVDYVYGHYFEYIYPFEYQLAKDNSLFREETKDNESNEFITVVSRSPDWINYLFEKYPVLYNLLATFTEQILGYISEIVTNYIKDISVLESSFSIDRKLLESICLFKGDLHNGRCVSTFIFKNGITLYYKPRNANNESFLQSLITALNELGLNAKLRIPQFENREYYSWHLHISDDDCDFLDLSLYYHNWGKLQAIFYVLGTQDIIPDNVLCSRGIPYIIDCESIILRPYIYNNGDALSTYLQKSVLKTGILPDWMFENADQRRVISSVLFEFRGNKKHLPHTSNNIYPMSRRQMNDFLSGFTYAYDFICHHKKKFVDLIRQFHIDKLNSRVLVHPTMIYSCLLHEQMTPEYLAGIKNLRPLLSTLIHEQTYGTHSLALAESIKQQLESGNIPYFYSSGNQTYLYSDTSHNICDDYYQFETNSEWIIDKLGTLSKQDLSYQCNIITENLKFYFDIIEDKAPDIITSQPNISINNQIDPYLSASIDISKLLEKFEILIDGHIGYVGRTKCLYDGAFQIGLHNNSIYDGTAGICLYYMTLYRHTSDVKLLSKAKAIFSKICNDITDAKISTNEYRNIPISPLTGITGALYLMERFHEELFHESTYTFVVDKLKDIIPLTEQYDYMSGITGLVCLLYQVRYIEYYKKIELMSLCGQRLLELSDISNDMMSWKYLDGAKYSSQHTMTLGGYSHGSSSISVAFYMLYLTTGENIYRDAFDMTLKHDRSFFSSDIRGWIDGRDTKHNIDSGSWCHGAAGIALSRLQLLSLGYNDNIIKEELQLATLQIKKRLNGNLSICHGAMGNIEILRALENYGIDIDCDLSLCCKNIIRSIQNKASLWCGDDNHDSLIGLFMGITGIGYQLLRLYSWDSIPCIMCMEIDAQNRIMH